MADDEPLIDPEQEPYDLDDEPYDLDDDTPLDLDDPAVLGLADEPPAEVDDEPVIDLDEGRPTDLAGIPPSVRTMAPPSKDPSDLSAEKERDRVIADVLRDQARREVLRDIAYRTTGPSLHLRLVAAGLVAVALVVWFLPVPGFRAQIPFPLAPEEETAGLKVATWVQAQQVEAFRLRRGRLPDVLREAGEALPGMSYERIDAATYRVSGSTERTTVTWMSTDSLDTQLRQAVGRLRGLQQ